MTPEEEEALKVRYRAFTRRLGAGVGLAGLYGVFLLTAVQATFVQGYRPVYLWGPVAFATALGLALFAKRRWVLAAMSAAFIAVHVRVLPQAAKVAAETPPPGSRADRVGAPADRVGAPAERLGAPAD